MPRLEEKIGLDFDILAKNLGADMVKTAGTKRIAVENNQHLFTKAVADLFRKNDDGGLWKVEAAEDGKEYFVRTDLTDSDAPVVKESSDWSIASDKQCANVTLSYKSIPLKKFASSEFGFTKDNVGSFCNRIMSSVSDSEFRKHVFAELSSCTQEILKAECPELLK